MYTVYVYQFPNEISTPLMTGLTRNLPENAPDRNPPPPPTWNRHCTDRTILNRRSWVDPYRVSRIEAAVTEGRATTHRTRRTIVLRLQ